MARWAFLLFVVTTLQALHLWRFASPQVSGFLSIDCGSDASSSDSFGIEWKPDAGLMQEGQAFLTGGISQVMSTLRFFNGTQSKYCYSLSSSAVTEGAFFLLRAMFWIGVNTPYLPTSADGVFRFMMIVDADEGMEIQLAYGNGMWLPVEIYMRAKRSSVDVCFARSTPRGDAPFVNSLELRPLPSTLTATTLMNRTGANCVVNSRYDYGVSTSSGPPIRYKADPIDRLWLPFPSPVQDIYATDSAIDTNEADHPPAVVLQTAVTGNGSIWLTFPTNPNTSQTYFIELYFAEINPAVNASGLRVFDLWANGIMINKLNEAIDVFARVGADTAYGYLAQVSPDSAGVLLFNLTPTAKSIYPPFVAGAELFYPKLPTPFTPSSVVNVIEAIKASLGLSSYTGDPCLPAGFGYDWLNCSGSMITALSLSNYGTGGRISEAINNLTFLSEIHLDGNHLRGEIPDFSALASLRVLDLSNNGLTGSIPESLANLKNLTVLNLQNNNLSGDVPAALLQRKQALTLNFTFSGNLFCESNANLGCASPTPSVPAEGSRAPSVPVEGNPASAASTSKKKSNMGVIIGAVLAGILVGSICICIAIYWLCTEKRQRAGKKTFETNQPPLHKKIIPKSHIEFTFQEIKDATNNFNAEIGKGGFGSVYRGRLPDGRLVAVKVASNASRQGSKEFFNEVELLSRIHHSKLVGFLGYCNEETLMLVYEFMSNGSLYDTLHGPYARESPLSWTARLKIMIDTAHGLDYLHSGCNPRIIHRDIKSSNILLNDKLEAKIADLGISRITSMNETGDPATALMGSLGYMDPEYLSLMKLSEKVDVFSFGVVLFEIVFGRKAIFLDDNEQIGIVQWATPLIERGAIEAAVDPSLQNEYDMSSLWKVLEVALACVRFPGSERPKMSTVYMELKEAERIDQESRRGVAVDKPSVEFTSRGDVDDTDSFTDVSAR